MTWMTRTCTTMMMVIRVVRRLLKRTFSRSDYVRNCEKAKFLTRQMDKEP